MVKAVLQNLKKGGITLFDIPSPIFVVRNTIEDFNYEDVSTLLIRLRECDSLEKM